MTELTDMEIFAHVVTAGSMSAAGREMGLSPAVISKRIRRLEERLGSRLLQRTTRQIALTEEGQGYYERVIAILASIEEAEAFVARRNESPRGTLRVTAPTSFARMHIAPYLGRFLEQYPDLTLNLMLSDTFVDIVGEGFDLAIRIAALENSSLIARRLAPNHRVICASPAYLARAGRPRSLADLAHHNCLFASHQDLWQLEGPEGPTAIRVAGKLQTNSSEVVRETVIAGLGIALRSTWDVGPALKSGQLEIVLPQYRESRRVAVYAVYPSRRFLPAKVRVFIDFLADLYGPEPYWDKGLALGLRQDGEVAA
ncbi:LysR family transcriptional regulator [Tepidamorphus gemmatus]|uniref:LysR family transcriptional regulator n=1 Tax=Tepidamorphus gemmatus TaxID=747076 RepID=A0A4R3M8Y5_9HYPH|nr:LysR family transcriptional regulator [Tepidamorphus gemmatus]TCT10031.1 LysR family transcriptional regulator [Tepidamorphus gemmatus]